MTLLNLLFEHNFISSYFSFFSSHTDNKVVLICLRPKGIVEPLAALQTNDFKGKNSCWKILEFQMDYDKKIMFNTERNKDNLKTLADLIQERLLPPKK